MQLEILVRSLQAPPLSVLSWRETGAVFEMLIGTRSKHAQRVLAVGLEGIALCSNQSCIDPALSALFSILDPKHKLVYPSTRGAIMCSLLRHWPCQLFEQLPVVKDWQFKFN